MKAIIIDADPSAREHAKRILEGEFSIEVIKTFDRYSEAIFFVRLVSVDFILMDTESNLEDSKLFAGQLSKYSNVIVYSMDEMAGIKCYEWDVLDYFLKPLISKRFAESMSKLTMKQLLLNPGANRNNDYLLIKEKRKVVKVLFDQILFIESQKDYILIETTDRQIVSKEHISHFEKKLPRDRFIRIHRSFMVAIDKIDAFTTSSIEIKGRELPIGRYYRNIFMEQLSVQLN